MDGKTTIIKFLLKAFLAVAFFELAFFLNYYLVSTDKNSPGAPFSGALSAPPVQIAGPSNTLFFFGSALGVNGSSISVEGSRVFQVVKKPSEPAKEKMSFDLSSAKVFVQGEKKSDDAYGKEVADFNKQKTYSVEKFPYRYVLTPASAGGISAGDKVLVSFSSAPSAPGVHKVSRLIIVAKAAK